jgi:hypothetical protein
MFNLLNPTVRRQIIEESKGSENVERKKISFGQFEIFKDRILQQVKAYLEGFYSKDTIQNTPIVSSVNLARRIVKKEASLYRRAPTREFYGLSEEQESVIRQIYADLKIDSIMMKANEYFKLQDQAHLYVVPRKGKLKVQALLAHNLDVVPSSEDPEEGEVYVINGFDRTMANVKVSEDGDSMDEMIADEDDYQAGLKASAVWSPLFNFVMDSNGNIMPAESYENPIGGVVPFVDINGGKDGEYWVRSGAALTDFTIQFNAGLTDLGNVVRMQGFGQAWLKAPSNLIPNNIQIGTNFVLRLPIDPNNPVETDFGYANANPDLQGSLSYLEGLLSSFLTSRGVDPKVVNAKMDSVKYSSGFERLLAMVEQFEASEADISAFQDAEQKLFKIIVAYVNTYGGTSVLPGYRVAPIGEDAFVEVSYKKPQSVMTEAEKLATIQQRKEMGLITQVEAIALDREIDADEAQEVYNRIQAEQGAEIERIMPTRQPETVDVEEDDAEDEDESLNG